MVQLKLITLRQENIKQNFIMIKNIFLTVLSFFILSNSYATHVVGGDFHVQWLSQNNYNVKLRYYRDCFNGLVNIPSTMDVGVYDAVTNSLQTIITLNQISTSIVNLGDNCYQPPASTCIEEGIFETNVLLPDNPNGYYLQSQINARNALAMNVTGATSGNGTMVWFAMIPDPAIGQNSSPDFGDYPTDAYFCAGSNKLIQYPVTDADGDSLVYSLVTPLDAWSTTNGTAAGSGAYPFYQDLSYQPNPAGGMFSLTDLVGGTSPMTIDVFTGEIIAGPSAIGFFTFAVRVEEFRNGVKIGEIRRDVQYASLPCTNSTPPSINLTDSISVYVDDQICFDVEVTASVSDSVYLHITSSNFDLPGNFVQPTIGASTSSYSDWGGVSGNTLQFPNLGTNSNSIGPGNAITGYGSIPLRYCWTPLCEDLDSIFHLDLVALVHDTCGNGIDTVTVNGDFVSVLYEFSQTDIHVVNTPPPTLLNVPDTLVLKLGDSTCIDLMAMDSVNVTDTLFLQPSSASFNFFETYQEPEQNANGDFYYDNFITDGSTFVMSNYTYSGFTPGAVGQVGLRFCWETNCEEVFIKEFDLTYNAFSTACGSDTITLTSFIEVEPPVGVVEQIPNVFSPNGDRKNDVYKLRGESDPCYDFMNVTIYNRWGQKVFESTDSEFEWDGTHKGKGECKPGTYYVIIDGSYGSTYTNDVNPVRVPNLVKDELYIQLTR